MKIDYSIAGEYAEQVRAIAIIESGENPDAVGDDGQARGLFQLHPAFYKQYYGFGLFPASVTHTWIEADITAVANFFYRLQVMDRDLTIQAFHLGRKAVFHEGERAPEYLARYDEALNRIRGEKV